MTSTFAQPIFFQVVTSVVICHLFSCFELRPSSSMNRSVRLSVCHTVFAMFPSSYHHEIFRSYFQWQKWGPCKRSRSKSNFKVTRLNKSSILTQIGGFPDCNSSLSSSMAKKWRTKLDVVKKICLIIFQSHSSNFKVTRDKNHPF